MPKEIYIIFNYNNIFCIILKNETRQSNKNDRRKQEHKIQTGYFMLHQITSTSLIRNEVYVIEEDLWGRI